MGTSGGERTAALAALIVGSREAEDGSGLVATLPIMGHALVEHQARLAAAAGARHIVVLVERLPVALTAAIDRLRRAGIRVEVARSIGDAADYIHPDERLLLFADGMLADQRLVERLAGGSAPALLVADDGVDRRHWERVDASARWTGLALLDGGQLRRTAAMLGDWDLQATLLRQALADGARRVSVADGADLAAPGFAMLIDDRASALDASRAIARDSRATGGQGAIAFALGPLVGALARAGAGQPIEALWLRIAGMLVALFAVAAFANGWRWSGLILLLLAFPLDAVATRLAAIRLAAARSGRRIGMARLLLGGAALVVLGIHLWHDGAGWGCPVLALGAVLGLAFAAGLRRLPGAARIARWSVEGDDLPWLLLPFALAGLWPQGLAALAAYALGSALVMLRRLVIETREPAPLPAGLARD